MKIKDGLLFFLFFSITIVIAWSGTGCANIIPPTGGPKDTIPPRLMLVNPPVFSRKFNANKIVFTFDEYIDPKDIRTQLIVNPVPKTDPIADGHLRIVTVRLKDTLQPNTTYSLNFGKGIKDVDEGNVLKNFTYVFSTGNYLDSAEFSGNVVVAATGKTDTSLIVILNRHLDDSAVVKMKPRYQARVDSAGRFHFHYLQAGTYALYALEDEGGTLRYLSPSQLFAFADSPVVIGGQYKPVTLLAYQEAPEIKSGKGSGTKTGGTTTKPSAKEKEKEKRLQLQTNISSGVFDVLDTLKFQFATSLESFDSSKLRFTDEGYMDIPSGQYHFVMDSTHKKITMFYKSPWPTDTKYHLIAAKDFAVDSAGRKLPKTDTISFQTKKETEYGEVRIRIPNLDLSRNPVLQFVQGDAVKYKFRFGRVKVFKVQLFVPGEYDLRILYDRNNNGIWDPGEFFGKHRQPEIVQPLPKKFNVKANWDNEKDIIL
jgi:hypothetical protein